MFRLLAKFNSQLPKLITCLIVKRTINDAFIAGIQTRRWQRREPRDSLLARSHHYDGGGSVAMVRQLRVTRRADVACELVFINS
jgi:hypothetical protein